jgi:hypothetical protein
MSGRFPHGLVAIFGAFMFVGGPVSLLGKDPQTITAEEAYAHATSILLGGSRSDLVEKRVGPVRVILTCGDAESREIANRAVGEINDAFGYGKLALSEAETATLEDDAITLFIGTKSQGRRLVERFGVSSPRAFRSGIYYYWWDKARRNHIRRGLVAVEEDVPRERQAIDLPYLLLASLGYRGIWSVHDHRSPSKTAEPSPLLSEFDAAVIRFCEKHVPPGVRAREIRNIFEREWPDLSAAHSNPTSR